MKQRKSLPSYLLFSILTLSSSSILVCMHMLSSDLYIMAKNRQQVLNKILELYTMMGIMALLTFALQSAPKIRKIINKVTTLDWVKVFTLIILSIGNSLLFFFGKQNETTSTILIYTLSLSIFMTSFSLMKNHEKHFKNARVLILIIICCIIGLRIVIKIIAAKNVITFTPAQSGYEFVEYQDLENSERYAFIFNIPIIISTSSLFLAFLLFNVKRSQKQLLNREESQNDVQHQLQNHQLSFKAIFRMICFRKLFLAVFSVTIFYNFLSVSRNFDLNKLTMARFKMSNLSVESIKIYSIVTDCLFLIPTIITGLSSQIRKPMKREYFIGTILIGLFLEAAWVTYVCRLSMLADSLSISLVIGVMGPSVLLIPLPFMFRSQGSLFSVHKRQKTRSICTCILAFCGANTLFSIYECFKFLQMKLVNQFELFVILNLFIFSYIMYFLWETSHTFRQTSGSKTNSSINSEIIDEKEIYDQQTTIFLEDEEEETENEIQIQEILSEKPKLKEEPLKVKLDINKSLNILFVLSITFIILLIPILVLFSIKKHSQIEQIEQLKLKRNYFQNYCGRPILFKATEPLVYARANNSKQKIEPISMILGSSGRRYDFERVTFSSFFENNDYPITKIFAIDDDYVNDGLLDMVKTYPNITFISANCRMGQLSAIDISLEFVDTQIYYSSEQDWEMYRKGYFEEALPLIQQHYNYAQVLSARSYAMETEGYEFGAVIPDRFQYQSLSFNPSLRRKSHYIEHFHKKYLGYSGFTNWASWGTGCGRYQKCLSQKLRWEGYTGYITKNEQIRHIGGSNRLPRSFIFYLPKCRK